ncbi:MAG: FG-GAP-like repeat-containing protein [Bacteroidota bacterium]
MKQIATLIFVSAFVFGISLAQTHIGAKFTPKLTTTSPDSAYFGDIGIRGAWVGPDLDHDGKPEIIVTDYTKRGRVHVFQAAGNDTVEWIWSSPIMDTLGGDSSPRTVRTGDLDGDGKGEIIFPFTGVGYLVFEWDGVPGSHNFGTIPSAIVPNNVSYGPNFGPKSGQPHESGNIARRIEDFEVTDVDKDGKDELITPVNLSPNKDFLIISAVGEWDFENQGFASFQIEGSTNLTATALGGGTPYGVEVADLDGDGKNEIVCHNWNYGDYYVMKCTGTDTYSLPDTVSPENGKSYFQQTGGEDEVALFGMAVGDMDKDGNQEVYFPWYGGTNYLGHVNVIDYKSGDDVLIADSTHSFDIGVASKNSSDEPISNFMGIVGDLDRNGKNELIIGSAYPSNVVAFEYQSGKITDPSSYTRKVYYTGENDIYASVTYTDSAGIIDTTTTVGEGFVSKMSQMVDIDGDGKFEIVLPYQALTDSATYTWEKYNADSTKFYTDSTKKITNPKKWAFRLLETDIAGSVENKEMTVITPDDYQLKQNYPNPFNPTTNINFVLPLNKRVTVKIYDMLGKEVRTLINNEEYAKGAHSVMWNARDNAGRQVASGAYIYKMTAGNVEKSMKLMLLK